VAGISSLDWSRDGERVAALDGHGNVHMFEPKSGRQWSALHWSKGVGKWIAAAHTFDGFVMIGMFSRGVHTLILEGDHLRTTRMEAFPPGTFASRLMVSPRDDIMASLYGRGVRIKRADEAFTTDRDVSLGEYLKDADSPASGEVVAITSRRNVTRWDWRGEPALMHTHQDTVRAASINERGELMLAERAALIHVDASGEIVKRWDVEGASILDVEWVPGRNWAVSAHKDGSVHIWDVTQGEVLARSTAHTERVAKIAISPDGRWLATGGWDGHIVIWDLQVIDAPVEAYQKHLHTLSESRVASFEIITQALDVQGSDNRLQP
jgi:WD40 repeat protein